jgi:misacylated tRNA(Ala) deacylase
VQRHAHRQILTAAPVAAAESARGRLLPDPNPLFWSDFSRERLPDLEARVNDVIGRDLALSATTIDEDEFGRRPDLVRTLNVRPPVVDGRVRVVEIAGFDAQACGGTHVHSTGEIGRVRIARFDNKGKDNKRLYWETV